MASPEKTADHQVKSLVESFLDEYQLLRFLLGAGGLVSLITFVLLGVPGDDLPIAAALVVVTAHAWWSRRKGVRAPLTMLALDITAWGWVMYVTADTIAISTATLAFQALVIALFADKRWLAPLAAYATAWYGLAHFSVNPGTFESVGVFLSVLITVGSAGIVVFRVRRWLDRLDGNRSQMLGTVSHELRNNLTGMMGMTELVSTDPEMSGEDARELTGLAHQQAVEATEIVEDLLTMSRVERSTLTVEVEDVDVNAEIGKIVHRFMGEDESVELQLDDDVGAARADALRVRQVVRNLVSNAIRYGGRNVVVSSSSGSDGVTVIVRDDGDGVPDEDVAAIFMPYKRSNATKRHTSSIGLGLWISRQLAQAMGGSLEYRRRDGHTEFVFCLTPQGDASWGSRASEVGVHGSGHDNTTTLSKAFAGLTGRSSAQVVAGEPSPT